MSRHALIVCAGVLMVVSAGCLSDSLRAPFGGPPQQTLVVAGSVNAVAARLNDALANAGMMVISKQQDGELRIAGMTKEKKVFCFHLKREMGEDKEKTHILLKWDREEDKDLWRTIVLPLAKDAPA